MLHELKLRQPTVDRFALGGGLELDSPPSSRKPGVAHDGVNFEPLPSGGYGRMKGYSRYDGQIDPLRLVKTGDYFYLTIVKQANLPAGSTVLGLTSGARGRICTVTQTGNSGVVGLVLNSVSGSFSRGEYVAYTAAPTAPFGTVLDFPTPTEAEHVYFRTVSAATARTSIGPPSGAGGILGGFCYEGQVYALRGSAAIGTATLSKATPTGWVAANNGFDAEVTFSGYVGTPSSMIGAQFPFASGNWTVSAVSVTSGTGEIGSPASGAVVLRDFVVFGAANTYTLPDTMGTLTNVQGVIFNVGRVATRVALPYSTTYEFTAGVVGAKPCIYITNGLGPALQFDGVTLQPIHTGAADDRPTHAAVFQNHLFLAQGNSVQNSSLGTAFEWSATTGAAEFVVDATVTGLIVLPGSTSGGALGVTTSGSHSILYGTSSADFKLVPFAQGTGARARTLASLGGNTLALSSAGVTTLSSTQNYGNFSTAALTANLNSWIQPRIGAAVGCCVSAVKSQYLLFFSTGDALVVGLVNGKFIGAMPLKLPASDVPTCAWGGQDDNGQMQPMFVGLADGRVVQMDAGWTFDGAPVDAYVELNFNAGRAAGVRRTLKRLVVEGTAEGPARFAITARVDQGSADAAQPAGETTSLTETITDTVVWSGTGTAGAAPIRVDGAGDTVAVRVTSTGYSDAFAITSVAIHHIPRRLAR